MLRCVNGDVTTIKPGHQRTTNARVSYGQMRVLQAVPYIRKEFTFGEQPSKPTIGNTWFQQCNTGRFYGGLGSSIVVQYSVGPMITLTGLITAREYVDRLGNQMHPMIQTLFPNSGTVFQDSTWKCSVVV
jgi:hypothetical protein